MPSGGVTCIIAGAASGADRLAAEWAVSRGIPLEEYPADWNTLGGDAGPIRNKRMLDEGHPDGVLAFPRANGKWGHGTQDMCNKAFDHGLPTSRVRS
jgi:hypothetical protein